ncbi:amino acid transporter, partial [Streptomyces sp. SID8455]|nr:amino acid transporter [Streptomyces sp. SID8455]
ALVGMVGIFLLMLRQPDTRDQLLATGALTAVLIGIGVVRQRRRGNDGAAGIPAQRK